MLRVEVPKAGKVNVRLDRFPIARAGAHPVVEQRLVQDDAARAVLNRGRPEIQQLERRQALVEAAGGFP